MQNTTTYADLVTLCIWTMKQEFRFVILLQILGPLTDSPGSAVARDRGAPGSSLTSVTALWSLSKTH